MADTGNIETTVLMDKDKTVMAVFEEIPKIFYMLVFEIEGEVNLGPAWGLLFLEC